MLAAPANTVENPIADPDSMSLCGDGFMGPFTLIFSFALVVFLGIVLVRAFWPGALPWWGEDAEAAIEILERRFASGEIDREEFKEKYQLLCQRARDYGTDRDIERRR